MNAQPNEALIKAASLFEPAAAELIPERSLARRRDWKFVMSEQQLCELLVRMAPNYSLLCADGERLARYETHYFDTADLYCYREHRRGRSRRYKVRARSYLDRAITVLEVKERDARGITQKSRIERDFGDLSLTDAEAGDFIANHSKMQASELRPSLSNSFRRITLLGLQRPQRITLDVHISFSAKESVRSLRGVAVAEVKSADSRNQTDVLRLFRSAGLRPQGFSKYCLGTALLNEGLRANRFLPALRRLARFEEVA
jgi:hypothetical protein